MKSRLVFVWKLWLSIFFTYKNIQLVKVSLFSHCAYHVRFFHYDSVICVGKEGIAIETMHNSSDDGRGGNILSAMWPVPSYNIESTICHIYVLSIGNTPFIDGIGNDARVLGYQKHSETCIDKQEDIPLYIFHMIGIHKTLS